MMTQKRDSGGCDGDRRTRAKVSFSHLDHSRSRFSFSLLVPFSLPLRRGSREWSRPSPELQNCALERPVQSHTPSSRTTHLCRSERQRIVLLYFLVVYVHLNHQPRSLLLFFSGTCPSRFPFHGICYRLLPCRSRIRSVHPFRFFLANLLHTVHFPPPNRLNLLCRTILSSFVTLLLRIGRNRPY